MAGAVGRAFVQVFADLSKFSPGLRKEVKRALDEQTKGLEFTELDKSANQAGKKAADELGKGLDSKMGPVLEKSGRKGGDSLWKGLSKGLSMAASLFLPALIGLALELVAALAPAIVALGATLPAAMFAAIGIAATLGMAFKGVGDALKNAFDPANAEKFNKAMEKLAPSARDFVMEIKNLAPAFRKLQQDVQQVFFNQLEGTLTRISRQLLPTLHKGLWTLSIDLGKISDNFLSAFGDNKDAIAAIFRSAHDALKPFIPALGLFISSMLTLAAVAGPTFATLSAGFAGLLTEFAAFIEQAAASGALSQFFEDALVILKQLGALLGSVFGLISAILGALQTEGGTALGLLTGLVEQVTAFLNSAQGKQMMADVFILLNTALAAMKEILPPLLPAIGELVSVLAGGLTEALKVITPFLADVSKYLGEHPDLLVAAAAAWGAYKIALMAVAAYQAIVLATNPVGLIVLGIAAIVAGAYLIYKNWGAVERAFKTAWEAIKGFFSGAWEWIQTAGANIGNWFTVTLPGFFTSLPGKIWAALSALPGMLGKLFLDALYAAGMAIGVGVGLMIAFWMKVPGWIWDAIKGIGNLFVNLWNLALSAGKKVLDAGIAAVIYTFTVLPGKIGSFIASLPGIIGRAFRQAWDWAKREVVSGADAVVDFVKKLPGRISGFMGDVGRNILNGLKSGINSVIRGFNAGINKVGNAIHVGLPNIPLLASGGLVNAPTLAVVGEAGPEAVVPMSDPSKAMAVAKSTGLLDILGSRMGNVGNTLVKVYLGTREITDILDVRIDKKMNDQANELAFGTR
jgi:phage-related protein